VRPLRPPLRWAGSKRGLLPKLATLIPSDFGRYFEPFSGSACLFFAIRPRVSVLGDVNADLIDFYRTLRRHPNLLHQSLSRQRKSSSNYYRWRALQPGKLDALKRATRFLFLNRLCFNGVYRTNRKGEFNVPLGENVGSFPDASDLRRCAIALRSASLVRGDFQATLSKMGRGDFAYLDPPFWRRNLEEPGQFGYGGFAIEKDQERLVKCLRDIHRSGGYFMLSFSRSPLTDALGSIYHTRRFVVTRNVAGYRSLRRRDAEIVITNYASTL